MNELVWSIGGMILTGENWSTGRETLYSVGGRWMNGYGAMVEWHWQGKPEQMGAKPVTVQLCPPQIPYGLDSTICNNKGKMKEYTQSEDERTVSTRHEVLHCSCLVCWTQRKCACRTEELQTTLCGTAAYLTHEQVYKFHELNCTSYASSSCYRRVCNRIDK